MCGVLGVFSPGHEAAPLAALGLFALQHRGQESAGVAVSDGHNVMVYKDLGLVAQVLDERRLPSLRGHLASAHCRYSTTGSTSWENSQPTFRIGPHRPVAISHNGNLVKASGWRSSPTAAIARRRYGCPMAGPGCWRKIGPHLSIGARSTAPGGRWDCTGWCRSTRLRRCAM